MTRTHVITGAGSGIGAVLADRLRDRGDRLILPVRSAARAEELRGRFPDAVMVVADLAEPSTLHGLGREVEGPVHGLIHSAGVVELGPVAELRLDALQHQLDVNLLAPAVLTRELLPHLRRAEGTIVFVNSGSGRRANPGWSGYAASKFALRGFAEALAGEEAEHGVRVSSVYPGRTATAMQEQVHQHEGADYDETRWIQPETIAEAILHALDAGPDAVIPEIVVRPR